MSKPSLAGITSGTAASTDTITIAGPGTLSSTQGALLCCVMYNDDYAANPVVDVQADSVSMNFATAKVSTALNTSCELWYIDLRSVADPVNNIVVTFSAGSTLSIIAVGMVAYMANNAGGPLGATQSADGTTSPATLSTTWSIPLTGRKTTLPVASTCGLYVGICVVNRGSSALLLSLSSGTEILGQTDAGSGITRISGAVAYVDATDGTDTVTWTESVNREWAVLTAEIMGGVSEGIIAHRGITPTALW